MSLNESSDQHITVLLEEAIDALLTEPDGIYVDGTFGRGGHSGLLLEKLSAEGMLFVIDKDPRAIAVAERLFGSDERFNIYHGSFTGIDEVLGHQQVDGVLLDLGVSSPQLDNSERGFSFQKDGPLDMRMNTYEGESAADWINGAEEQEIARVIWEYGEDRYSRRIARAIVREREETPIETTHHLANIVAAASPSREKGKHPATRVFQAIRIHVNRELSDLTECLDKALAVLKPGGRLVVISFHSLEDRIVKRFIRRHVKGDELPRWMPVKDEQLNKRMKSLSKAIKPGDAEINANPRSRSAVMRVAMKLM